MIRFLQHRGEKKVNKLFIELIKLKSAVEPYIILGKIVLLLNPSFRKRRAYLTNRSNFNLRFIKWQRQFLKKKNNVFTNIDLQTSFALLTCFNIHSFWSDAHFQGPSEASPRSCWKVLARKILRSAFDMKMSFLKWLPELVVKLYLQRAVAAVLTYVHDLVRVFCVVMCTVHASFTVKILHLSVNYKKLPNYEWLN